MKQWMSAAVVAAACGTSGAQAKPVTHAAGVEPWQKIPIPPLHDFKPAEPKKVVLDNGLVIFLQVDHELPFVNGSILIRGGSRDEPADKTGLVRLYGQAWRTSGTTAQSGDALDQALSLKAADVETGGGLATTSVSWSSFAKDFDQVFAVAQNVLLHPDFRRKSLRLRSGSLRPASRGAMMTPPASHSGLPSRLPTAKTALRAAGGIRDDQRGTTG